MSPPLLTTLMIHGGIWRKPAARTSVLERCKKYGISFQAITQGDAECELLATALSIPALEKPERKRKIRRKDIIRAWTPAPALIAKLRQMGLVVSVELGPLAGSSRTVRLTLHMLGSRPSDVLRSSYVRGVFRNEHGYSTSCIADVRRLPSSKEVNKLWLTMGRTCQDLLTLRSLYRL